MNVYLYSLFDKDLKVYEAPFVAPIPKTDIKEAYRRQFFHEPQKAYDSHLDRKALYSFGEFDELSCSIKGSPEYVCDISDILPPSPPTPVDDLNAKVEKLLRMVQTKYDN